ncbi:MAG TPA: Rpp14/Pop5 family protein [Thermoplasmata archaeon]
MGVSRPRYRYVAFRVESSRAFSREEVRAALRDLPDRPWLVDFEGSEGLARATNLTKDAVVEALNSLRRIGPEAVRVTTLGTSGTIRKARAKYLA